MYGNNNTLITYAVTVRSSEDREKSSVTELTEGPQAIRRAFIKYSPSRFQFVFIGTEDNYSDSNGLHLGRLAILKNLHQRFEGRDLISHLLWGMSGIGKTSLAVQYIEEYEQEYEIIWWFNANLSLEPQFANFAQQVFGIASPDKDINVIKSVYASLENQDKWLFVFDNAGSWEAMRPYLPSTYIEKRIKSAHCLIISQHNNYPFQKTKVSGFITEEIELFYQEYFKSYSKSDYYRLAGRLECHPYALMKVHDLLEGEPSSTIQDYLKKLEIKSDVVFSNEYSIEQDGILCLSDILKSLSLSVDHFLDWADSVSLLPIAKLILNGLAYLPLSSISSSLLLEMILVFLEENKEYHSLPQNILSQLIKSSVIERLSEKIIRLHQLMRITLQMKQYSHDTKTALLLLLQVFNRVFIYDYTHPTSRVLLYLDQIEMFLEERKFVFNTEIEKKHVLSLYIKLGNYYHYECRNNKKAKDYYQRALALIEEGIESSNEDQSDVFYHLAYIILHCEKDYENTLKYADRILLLWGDSPKTITSPYSCLALEIRALFASSSHCYVIARQTYQQCLDYLCAQEILKIRNISYVLSCIESDMGRLCYQRKDYEKAINHFELALKYKGRCDLFLISQLPEKPNDPSVEAYFFIQGISPTLHYWEVEKQEFVHVNIDNLEKLTDVLVQVALKEGKSIYLNYGQCEDLITSNGGDAQEKMGRDHPDTLVLYRNIGECSLKMKQFNKAKYFFEQALSLAEKFYGKESINHLELHYFLAKCECGLRKEDESQKIYTMIVTNLTRQPQPSWVREKDNVTKSSFLKIAIRAGHLEAIKLLVRGPGNSSNQAMLLAAKYGGLEIVKWFLEETHFVDISAKDNEGNSILLCAAFSGQIDIVEWLLYEKKITGEERNNNGETAFLVAASNGELEMAKLLLKLYPSSNKDQDKDGNTALLLAGLHDHLPVVEWLLENKIADIEEQNTDGHSIRAIAEITGNFDMLTWLEARMAGPKSAMTPS